MRMIHGAKCVQIFRYRYVPVIIIIIILLVWGTAAVAVATTTVAMYSKERKKWTNEETRQKLKELITENKYTSWAEENERKKP